MTASILDSQFINEDSHSDEPKTILIAGASGGIGQAFCQLCASLFPEAKLIRLMLPGPIGAYIQRDLDIG